ncbi:MAG: Ig-like domain-containing protein, partial [Chloroflexota bacterium]
MRRWLYTWRRVILLALVLLAAAAAAVLLLGAPRILSVAPQPGAQRVAVDAPLRISFSRRMDASTADLLRLEPPLSGETAWEGRSLLFTPRQPWPAGQVITVT